MRSQPNILSKFKLLAYFPLMNRAKSSAIPREVEFEIPFENCLSFVQTSVYEAVGLETDLTLMTKAV